MKRETVPARPYALPGGSGTGGRGEGGLPRVPLAGGRSGEDVTAQNASKRESFGNLHFLSRIGGHGGGFGGAGAPGLVWGCPGASALRFWAGFGFRNGFQLGYIIGYIIIFGFRFRFRFRSRQTFLESTTVFSLGVAPISRGSQTKNSDGMHPAGGDGRPGAPGRVFGGTQVRCSPNRYGQTRYIWFVLKLICLPKI